MKAFAQKGYGSADAYELIDATKPVPSKNEVLVKVVATAVNDWEWGILKAPWPVRLFIGLGRPRGKYHVMGCDMAGRVEAVGRNVIDFGVGDEVYGDLSGYRFGGFAEYVCVSEQHLHCKPSAVSFEQAAAIPHAAELALQAIRSAPELRAGQEVLVNGAAGGVGTLAIQILKQHDLTVTGVDHAAKLGRLLELGYDEVVSYPEADFTRLGKRYDLIIDVKTSAPAHAYLRVLKPSGVYATVGGDKVLPFMLLAPVISLFTRKSLKAVMLKPNRNLSEISDMVSIGTLRPVLDEVFAFSELQHALRKFHDARHVGKIIVRMP